jgi:hypothetical protein
MSETPSGNKWEPAGAPEPGSPEPRGVPEAPVPPSPSNAGPSNAAPSYGTPVARRAGGLARRSKALLAAGVAVVALGAGAGGYAVGAATGGHDGKATTDAFTHRGSPPGEDSDHGSDGGFEPDGDGR